VRGAVRQNRRQQTLAEERLWQALRNRQLNGAKFRRQHVIGRFIVDFYCAEAHLVIEVDGPIHATQIDEDSERDRDLKNRGLTVLRFKNNSVIQELARVLDRIAAHLPRVGLDDTVAMDSDSPSPKSERGLGGEMRRPLSKGSQE
jgi:very-short-patch-repair endonuclease